MTRLIQQKVNGGDRAEPALARVRTRQFRFARRLCCRDELGGSDHGHPAEKPAGPSRLLSLAWRIQNAEIGGADHGHPLGPPVEGAAVGLRRVLVSLPIGVSVCCHHQLQDGRRVFCGPSRPNRFLLLADAAGVRECQRIWLLARAGDRSDAFAAELRSRAACQR